MRRLSLPMPLEDAPLVAFPVPLPRDLSPLLANCLISVLHFYLPFTHLARSVRDAVLFIVFNGKRRASANGDRYEMDEAKAEGRGERRDGFITRGGREGGCTHYIFTTTLLSTAEALIGWQTLDALLDRRRS